MNIELRNIIIRSKDYEEEFVRDQLSVILEERLKGKVQDEPRDLQAKFMKHQRIPARSWRDLCSKLRVTSKNGSMEWKCPDIRGKSRCRRGQSVDSGGTIQIMSAFGEREVTELKIFNLKIDDSRHGAVSKANEEEQLSEGRETRSTFIKMQREDDTLKKLWSLAEQQKELSKNT
ncbi:hypothetical protein TNCV_2817681 [Trichonephila clavipes]|nr:hypothetical protein TNCV_2817681 [Trichonephila clavipes]